MRGRPFHNFELYVLRSVCVIVAVLDDYCF